MTDVPHKRRARIGIAMLVTGLLVATAVFLPSILAHWETVLDVSFYDTEEFGRIYGLRAQRGSEQTGDLLLSERFWHSATGSLAAIRTWDGKKNRRRITVWDQTGQLIYQEIEHDVSGGGVRKRNVQGPWEAGYEDVEPHPEAPWLEENTIVELWVLQYLAREPLTLRHRRWIPMMFEE